MNSQTITDKMIEDHLGYEKPRCTTAEKPLIYIGIGPNRGRRVYPEDAFDVAIEESFSTYENMIEFRQNFDSYFSGNLTSTDYRNFRAEVVEWFYSGNWVEGEEQ